MRVMEKIDTQKDEEEKESKGEMIEMFEENM